MANEQVYGKRWRIVRRLGAGGQGTVYEVEDGREVSTPAEMTVRLGQLLAEFNRVYNNSQERARVSSQLTEDHANSLN